MAKLRSLIWLVLLSSAFDHVVCVVDSCFSVQMKYMDNFIPQESELWQVDIPSQNSIACGYFCKNDGSCAAVSFNTQSYTCKGKYQEHLLWFKPILFQTYEMI